MEGDGENVPLSYGHGVAIHLSQHVNVFPDLLHPRSPNEHCVERLALEGELGLERRQLTTERVAADLDVEDTEVVPIQHDHPGAGAQDRPTARDELDERRTKPFTLHAEPDGGGLATGDHERVEPVEVRGRAYLAYLRTELGQGPCVSFEPALQGEYSYNGIAPGRARPAPSRTTHQPRFWSSPPFS